MMPKSSPAHTYDYQAAANNAMIASIKARIDGGADLQSPICIYGLCEAHNLKVRFNDINMEGMYERSSTPRVHLSALRPLYRRNFTCAHELGHHVFGHGSTIDELREENQSVKPINEFLADTFAAFLLMPTLGLRNAFAIRNINPNQVTPEEAYRIACNFGVGYATLVNHLAYGLHMISQSHAELLLKSSPKTIRIAVLGDVASETLIMTDEHWSSATLDVEVSTHILLPNHVIVSGDQLEHQSDLSKARLYRAIKPGIVRASSNQKTWATFIRISRRNYVGLAQYRHLEDESDD